MSSTTSSLEWARQMSAHIEQLNEANKYLANRAEELSSLLAGMTTERDWFKSQCENLQEEVRTAAVDARIVHEQNKRLRETLRQAREQIEFLEQALEEYHGSRQPNPALDAIDAALNHAEQGERELN